MHTSPKPIARDSSPPSVAAALAVPAVATALTRRGRGAGRGDQLLRQHRRPDPGLHGPRRGRRLGGRLGDRGHARRRRLAVLGVHVRRAALDRADTAGLRPADARRRWHGAAGAGVGRRVRPGGVAGRPPGGLGRGRPGLAAGRDARRRLRRGPRPPCRARRCSSADATSQARVVPPNPPAPADDLAAWVAANIGPIDVTPVTSGFPTLDAMADAVSDLPGSERRRLGGDAHRERRRRSSSSSSPVTSTCSP